ncbi:hypothetical protein, partial [Pseudomonas viridiflava]|uniref:hypothetical protein n=1 Tax=Pseudomonas viridiflava TaxID=33069 RepID=UPI00197CBC2B
MQRYKWRSNACAVALLAAHLLGSTVIIGAVCALSPSVRAGRTEVEKTPSKPGDTPGFFVFVADETVFWRGRCT